MSTKFVPIMPLGPKVAQPPVLPGTWPAFNRCLYITQVSDLGPLGPLVSIEFDIVLLVRVLIILNFYITFFTVLYILNMFSSFTFMIHLLLL